MNNQKRELIAISERFVTKTHKTVNAVYKTSNYEMFQLSSRNRNIIISKELLEQAKQGFISPIIVNEDLVIIDGQHRFQCAKDLSLEIEYIIKPGLGDDDIIRMNTVQRKWSLENYIESYANDGKIEYIKLLELLNKNYSNVTVTSQVARNSLGSPKVIEDIKNGVFQFYKFEKAVEFLQYYERFREETKTPKRTTTATALYELFRYKKFDRNRMIEKTISTELSEEIKVKTFLHTDILRSMIGAYNKGFGASNPKFINFHISSSSTVIIDEEKEEWATKNV